MATASLSGAVAAYINSLTTIGALSQAVYRDRPTPNKPTPYITVYDGISTNIAVDTNQFDKSQVPDLHELFQVDLWETWQNNDDTVAEVPSLWPRLVIALSGSRLLPPGNPGAPPFTVNGILFINRICLKDLEANLVHTALTFRADRALQ